MDREVTAMEVDEQKETDKKKQTDEKKGTDALRRQQKCVKEN